MKHTMDFLKKAVSLTQLLVTVAAPVTLCILGGLWLCRRFSLPRGVMALFVLLGVASSLWNFWKWLKPFLKQEEEPPAPSFNDHF